MKKCLLLILVAVLCMQVLANKTAEKESSRNEKTVEYKDYPAKTNWKDYELRLDGGGSDDGVHGFLPIVYKYHMGAMFFFWCPVTDFAVTISMYFKYKTQWY
jgi:hypothetical protein